MTTLLGRYRRRIATSCVGMAGLALLLSCSSAPSASVQPTAAQPSPAATQPATAVGLAMPPGLPQPTISGRIPLAIPAHDTNLSPEQARPYFDMFSWQSFIALNWPAVDGQRGAPDQPDNPAMLLGAPNGTATVWGTYKEAFDLFGQPADQRPSDWTVLAEPVTPCGAQPGTKVFVMTAKGSSILDDDNEAFSYPLIDQFQNYVSFEIRLNETQYTFIRGSDQNPKSWLYLAKNLAAAEPIQMPASSPPSTQGAIMLKAAWREMTAQDDQSRYYVINAQVYDPLTKTCSGKPMGLVGFHIVQKLKDFPEWIWSTFEQVDNVQRGAGAGPNTPISFNNGTANPATVGGYANRPPAQSPDLQPKDQRVPVQVTRLNPIPTTPAGASTADLNAIYQQALAGTVWSHYELVFTQWPSDPGNFVLMEQGGVYPQGAGAAFPANGVTNTTMETYFQSPSDALGAGGNSCMSCHYRAGQSDFSWSLMRRAH